MSKESEIWFVAVKHEMIGGGAKWLSSNPMTQAAALKERDRLRALGYTAQIDESKTSADEFRAQEERKRSARGAEQKRHDAEDIFPGWAPFMVKVKKARR